MRFNKSVGRRIDEGRSLRRERYARFLRHDVASLSRHLAAGRLARHHGRLVADAFIPTHATHYVGVGGVVINDRRELLVVCERHRATSRRYYKLPGGALQAGEHLVDAVTREVLEETGVEARFEALVCFRHWHGYRYGKSDIYFVCRLTPLNTDLTMQAEEIEECLWMPVDEYLSHELVSPFNKRIVRAALSAPGVSPEWIEGHTDPARYEFFMPDETHSNEPLADRHG
ncbi:MAG: NUDIX domain-containing protein [Chloroflexi bacterium]|nr:NUDIX domain-containing protein [Chloroflexota bacterium]